MKFVQDVRDYAKEQNIEAEKALAAKWRKRRKSLLIKEARFLKEPKAANQIFDFHDSR